MVTAEAEVEVARVVEEIEGEVAREVAETEGGGEAPVVLEAVTVAVEVGVPLVVALADVAGVTSASGRRTFQRFSPLSSRS